MILRRYCRSFDPFLAVAVAVDHSFAAVDHIVVVAAAAVDYIVDQGILDYHVHHRIALDYHFHHKIVAVGLCMSFYRYVVYKKRRMRIVSLQQMQMPWIERELCRLENSSCLSNARA